MATRRKNIDKIEEVEAVKPVISKPASDKSGVPVKIKCETLLHLPHKLQAMIDHSRKTIPKGAILSTAKGEEIMTVPEEMIEALLEIMEGEFCPTYVMYRGTANEVKKPTLRLVK